MGKPTQVLFESDETNRWPNGLEISETLLTVKKGKSSQVDIDITNNTNHERVLRGRTQLGRLQLVQSVIPFEVKMKEPDSGNNGIPQEAPGSGVTKPFQPRDEDSGVVSMCSPRHINDMHLEGLIPAQKEMALKLFPEEADAFAKDDNDVGCIPDLGLDLDLEEQTPV